MRLLKRKLVVTTLTGMTRVTGVVLVTRLIGRQGFQVDGLHWALVGCMGSDRLFWTVPVCSRL